MVPTQPGGAGTPAVAGTTGGAAGRPTTPTGGTPGIGTAGIGAAGQIAASGGSPAAGGGGSPAAAGASGGAAGAVAAAGTGAAAGASGAAGTSAGAAGAAGGGGTSDGGACCDDGNCLCHGDAPSELTSEDGPFGSESYSIQGVGCVYYPTDAEPPFAAVAISDGFGGSGGCGRTQTDGWGPLLASHGIVAMIVVTGSGDQPNARGAALTEGVAAFKSENEKSDSPLFGKLAGRYGTAGFSMGGGGTSYASQDDGTLLSSVAIMPWGPVRMGVEVPTLVICGASDGIASCASHGNGLYAGIADSVPKMRVQVSGGHNGQPSAGGRQSGAYGLAFQKVFLEGDTRWRPLLIAADSEETNIQ
ncbi:MAG: hypothetical protein ABW321_09210 [Polyangiales bacterium]